MTREMFPSEKWRAALQAENDEFREALRMIAAVGGDDDGTNTRIVLSAAGHLQCRLIARGALAEAKKRDMRKEAESRWGGKLVEDEDLSKLFHLLQHKTATEIMEMLNRGSGDNSHPA